MHAKIEAGQPTSPASEMNASYTSRRSPAARATQPIKIFRLSVSHTFTRQNPESSCFASPVLVFIQRGMMVCDEPATRTLETILTPFSVGSNPFGHRARSMDCSAHLSAVKNNSGERFASPAWRDLAIGAVI
jgi:hypothetical protein